MLKRHCIPWKMNPEQPISRHIPVKLLGFEEERLRLSRQKDHVTYSRMKIRLPSLYLKAMLYDRIKCHNTIKATKM